MLGTEAGRAAREEAAFAIHRIDWLGWLTNHDATALLLSTPSFSP
jgi:hypothetical protein